MSITTSIHINTASKVNVKHNLNVENYRDGLGYEDGRIIDHERTPENIVLVDRYDVHKSFRTNVKDILGEKNVAVIEKKLAEYNEGKRKARQVSFKDLFDEKRKQHFEHRECVIQFGNRDGDIPFQTQAEMLKQAFNEFVKTHKDCFITSAVIHMDESTPHLHITFIPIKVVERERGLPFAMSYDAVVGGGRDKFKERREELDEGLERIAGSYGYKVKNPKIDRAHGDQRAYNEQREREAKLEAERRELDELGERMSRGAVALQVGKQELEKERKELEDAKAKHEQRLKDESFKNLLDLSDKVFRALYPIARKFGIDGGHDAYDNWAKTLDALTNYFDRLDRQHEPTREVERNDGRW